MSTSRLKVVAAKRPARTLFTLTLLAAAIGGASSAMAAPEVVSTTKVDENVYEIVFSPSNHVVYAAVTGERLAEGESTKNRVTPGIVVLNANTLEQVNKIATGKVTPFGLAINNQSKKLYAIDTPKGQWAFTISSPAKKWR